MLRPCKIRQGAKPLSLGSSRALTGSCCVGPSPTSDHGSSSETKDTLKLEKLLPEAFHRGGNTSSAPRQIVGTEGLLPAEPGKLWRTKVQQSFWVLFQPLFLLVVCFAELIEQGWGFTQGLSPLQRCVVQLSLKHGLQCAMSSFSKVCIRKCRQALR